MQRGDAVVVLPGWAARPFRHYYGPWEERAAARVLLDREEYPAAAERLARYERVFVIGAHLEIDPAAAQTLESLGAGRPRLERSDYGSDGDAVILVVYGAPAAEE